MLTSEQIKQAIPHTLLRADLPGLTGRVEGKVRDSFVQGGRRVLVTTDRVSAFDRVLGAIPFKGQVLNQLSAWWFARTSDLVSNHVLAVPDPNVTIAHEAEALQVEVIVRGFITGVTSTALWTLYQQGVERPYGLDLPAGLRKNDALPAAVITPTTKGPLSDILRMREGRGARLARSEEGAYKDVCNRRTTQPDGMDRPSQRARDCETDPVAPGGAHDERLTCDEVMDHGLVEPELWAEVQRVALAIFARGQQVARQAGLILVDTKYEFGLIDGKLALIDEVHTPDSSRYWVAESYEAAHGTDRAPEQFDKEALRLWYVEQGYRGEGDPPAMPAEVQEMMALRYVSAYERLTGETFDPGQQPANDRIQRALDQYFGEEL